MSNDRFNKRYACGPSVEVQLMFVREMLRRQARFFKVILLVIVIGAPILLGWQSARYLGLLPTPGPHLTFSNNRDIDLGEGESGETLYDDFQIKNTGTESLVFDIVAGCACAVLEPREGQLEPGEAKTVRIGVRLRHEGQQENVPIGIHTNDPGAQEVTLHYRARCPLLYDVRPQTLNFGSVVAGSSATRTLEIRNSRGDPLNSSYPLQFVSTNQFVRLDRKQDEPDTLALKVTLEDSAPRGVIAGDIVLRGPPKGKEVRVPMIATVEGLLQVAPKFLYLQKDARETGIHPVRFMVWRTDRAPLGSLVKHENSAGLLLDELSIAGENSRQFIIKSAINALLPSQGTIKLQFADTPEPAVLEFEVAEGAEHTQ